jgi:DNA-binding NarL/FixJ family response regulator
MGNSDLAELKCAALDLVPFGVMITTRDATILWANALARAVLETANGLLQVSGRLVASVSASDQTLRDMISATAGGGGRVSSNPIALSVERRNAAGPLALMLAPAHASDTASDSAAIIFVCDPFVAVEPDPALVASVFKFSRAETEIALALGDGDSVDDIATKRGVSRNTVRAQLAAMMDKAGVTSQRQLIGCILRMPRISVSK